MDVQSHLSLVKEYSFSQAGETDSTRKKNHLMKMIRHVKEIKRLGGYTGDVSFLPPPLQKMIRPPHRRNWRTQLSAGGPFLEKEVKKCKKKLPDEECEQILKEIQSDDTVADNMNNECGELKSGVSQEACKDRALGWVLSQRTSQKVRKNAKDKLLPAKKENRKQKIKEEKQKLLPTTSKENEEKKRSDAHKDVVERKIKQFEDKKSQIKEQQEIKRREVQERVQKRKEESEKKKKKEEEVLQKRKEECKTLAESPFTFVDDAETNNSKMTERIEQIQSCASSVNLTELIKTNEDVLRKACESQAQDILKDNKTFDQKLDFLEKLIICKGLEPQDKNAMLSTIKQIKKEKCKNDKQTYENKKAKVLQDSTKEIDGRTVQTKKVATDLRKLLTTLKSQIVKYNMTCSTDNEEKDVKAIEEKEGAASARAKTKWKSFKKKAAINNKGPLTKEDLKWTILKQISKQELALKKYKEDKEDHARKVKEKKGHVKLEEEKLNADIAKIEESANKWQEIETKIKDLQDSTDIQKLNQVHEDIKQCFESNLQRLDHFKILEQHFSTMRQELVNKTCLVERIESFLQDKPYQYQSASSLLQTLKGMFVTDIYMGAMEPEWSYVNEKLNTLIDKDWYTNLRRFTSDQMRLTTNYDHPEDTWKEHPKHTYGHTLTKMTEYADECVRIAGLMRNAQQALDEARKTFETNKASYDVGWENRREAHTNYKKIQEEARNVVDMALKTDAILFSDKRARQKFYTSGRLPLTIDIDVWKELGDANREKIKNFMSYMDQAEKMIETMKTKENITKDDQLWSENDNQLHTAVTEPDFISSIGSMPTISKLQDASSTFNSLIDEKKAIYDQIVNATAKFEDTTALESLSQFKGDIQLVNSIEDLLGTIRIVARGLNRELIKNNTGENIIKLSTTNPRNIVLNNTEYGPFHSTLLPETKNPTNKELYNNLKNTLQRIQEGKNVTTVAYGYSGSGKTYGFFNPVQPDERLDSVTDPGIVYKYLQDHSDNIESVGIYVRELYGESEDASTLFLSTMTGSILEYAHEDDIRQNVSWRGNVIHDKSSVRVDDESQKFFEPDKIQVVETSVDFINLMDPTNEDSLYGVVTDDVKETAPLDEAHKGLVARNGTEIGICSGANKMMLFKTHLLQQETDREQKDNFYNLGTQTFDTDGKLTNASVDKDTNWTFVRVLGKKTINDLEYTVHLYQREIDKSGTVEYLATPMDRAMSLEKKYRQLEGDYANKVKEVYNAIEKLRKGKRVLKTPNNPDSSRGHLFLSLKITFKNKKTGYWNIGDLAGSENPLTIADAMFGKGDWPTQFRDELCRDMKDTNCTTLNSKIPNRNHLAWKIIKQGFFINESNMHLMAYARSQDPQVKTYNLEYGKIDLGTRKAGDGTYTVPSDVTGELNNWYDAIKDNDFNEWFPNKDQTYAVRLYNKIKDGKRLQSIPVCITGSRQNHGKLPKMFEDNTWFRGWLGTNDQVPLMMASGNMLVRGGEVFAELIKSGDNSNLRQHIQYDPYRAAQNPVAYIHGPDAVRLDDQTYKTFLEASVRRKVEPCPDIAQGLLSGGGYDWCYSPTPEDFPGNKEGYEKAKKESDQCIADVITMIGKYLQTLNDDVVNTIDDLSTYLVSQEDEVVKKASQPLKDYLTEYGDDALENLFEQITINFTELLNARKTKKKKHMVITEVPTQKEIIEAKIKKVTEQQVAKIQTATSLDDLNTKTKNAEEAIRQVAIKIPGVSSADLFHNKVAADAKRTIEEVSKNKEKEFTKQNKPKKKGNLDKVLEDTYNELNFGWADVTETTVVKMMEEKLNKLKDEGGHPKVLNETNPKRGKNLQKIKRLVEKKHSEYDKKKKEEDNIGFCKTAFNNIKAQEISATEKQKKLEHTRCAEVPDLYKKYSDELQVQVDQEQKQMEEEFTKAKSDLQSITEFSAINKWQETMKEKYPTKTEEIMDLTSKRNQEVTALRWKALCERNFDTFSQKQLEDLTFDTDINSLIKNNIKEHDDFKAHCVDENNPFITKAMKNKLRGKLNDKQKTLISQEKERKANELFQQITTEKGIASSLDAISETEFEYQKYDDALNTYVNNVKNAKVANQNVKKNNAVYNEKRKSLEDMAAKVKSQDEARIANCQSIVALVKTKDDVESVQAERAKMENCNDKDKKEVDEKILKNKKNLFETVMKNTFPISTMKQIKDAIEKVEAFKYQDVAAPTLKTLKEIQEKMNKLQTYFTYDLVARQMLDDKIVDRWANITTYAIDKWNTWNQTRAGTEPTRGFVLMIPLLNSFMGGKNAKLVIVQNMRVESSMNAIQTNGVKMTLEYSDSINPMSFKSAEEIRCGTTRSMAYELNKTCGNKHELMKIDHYLSNVSGQSEFPLYEKPDKTSANKGSLKYARKTLLERFVSFPDAPWKFAKIKLTKTEDGTTKDGYLKLYDDEGKAVFRILPDKQNHFGPWISTWEEKYFPTTILENKEEEEMLSILTSDLIRFEDLVQSSDEEGSFMDDTIMLTDDEQSMF